MGSFENILLYIICSISNAGFILFIDNHFRKYGNDLYGNIIIDTTISATFGIFVYLMIKLFKWFSDINNECEIKMPFRILLSVFTIEFFVIIIKLLLDGFIYNAKFIACVIIIGSVYLTVPLLISLIKLFFNNLTAKTNNKTENIFFIIHYPFFNCKFISMLLPQTIRKIAIREFKKQNPKYKRIKALKIPKKELNMFIKKYITTQIFKIYNDLDEGKLYSIRTHQNIYNKLKYLENKKEICIFDFKTYKKSFKKRNMLNILYKIKIPKFKENTYEICFEKFAK